MEVASLYCRLWRSLFAHWLLKSTRKQSQSCYHLQIGSTVAAEMQQSFPIVVPSQEKYCSFNENVNFHLLCEYCKSRCRDSKISVWEQSTLLVMRMTICCWWYETTDVLLIHLHPWHSNFFLGKIWIVAVDISKPSSSNHCVLTNWFF